MNLLQVIIIPPTLLRGATATAEFHTPANNEPQDLKQIWNTQNTKIDIWGEVDANDYNVALGYGSANLSYNGDQVEETLYFPIIEISNKNNPSDKLILVPNKNIEDIQDSYSKLADENEDPAQPTIYTWDISQFTSKHENCFSNNWYPYLQIEE